MTNPVAFNRNRIILWICFCTLTPWLSTANAQISSFKMGDTLFLKPDDEFMDVRLSKFSAVKVGDDHNYRTLVYYDGKPFTGTIIKNRGLYHDGYNILGSNVRYNESESDSSFFCINYLEGRFYKDYLLSNEFVDTKLWFDKNGNPDKSGYVAIKKNSDSDKQNMPIVIPKFKRFSDRFYNENLVINLYSSDDIGVFNHRGNTDKVSFLPIEFQSLEELVRKYSIENLELNDCNLIDTVSFIFSNNKLISLSYKDECESSVQFDNTGFIADMPVFDAATPDGFQHIDYSKLLFSSDWDELSASHIYFIETILSSGEGYFFNTLDKIPKWAKITSKGYSLDVQLDRDKTIKDAKRKPLKDIFYTENYKGPFRDPVYYLSYPIKSFTLRSDLKDYQGDVKHIKSDYTVSADGKYQLTSEYWYKKDTVSIITSGDLKNNILNKFEVYLNIESGGFNMNSLKIRYQTSGTYILEGHGKKLGWDSQAKKYIIAFEIEALNTNKGDFYSALLNLISNGKSTFTYSDGSQKQYKYKDGVLIID